MINLLPSEQYKELHAARHNVLLVRLLISSVVCFVGVLFAIVSTFLLIGAQENTALAAKEEGQQKLSQYAEVEKQTQDFQKNLQTAEQILDQSISYRTMLINVAQALPDDAIISSLQLTPTTIGTPNILTISTTSYDKAVALKDSLNESSIAKDVSIIGVSTSDEGMPTLSSEYPVSVQMNMTFTEGLLVPTWINEDEES